MILNIILLFFFMFCVVIGIKRTNENIEENKNVNEYLKNKAKENLQQSISEYSINTFKVTKNELNQFQFILTPKSLDKSDNSVILGIRGKLGKYETVGLHIKFWQNTSQLKNIDTNDEIEIYPITFHSNGKESDNLINEIRKYWAIEKTGKIRMLNQVLAYTMNKTSFETIKKGEADLEIKFGVKNFISIEPSVHININWSQGLVSINETNLFAREILINKFIV